MKKVSWNDLHNLTSSEIKKKYKINDSQLEMGTRRHLDGANTQERRQFYETVYSSKWKR